MRGNEKHENNSKIFSIILIALLLCSCGSTKLYTEEEVLGYLNNRFDTEFVVLKKNKITRDEMQYTVALKDDESVTFTITNELIVTGSDIGPKRNYIDCKEITDYFEANNS